MRKASLLNRVFGRDVIDPQTGEVIVEQGQVFTEEHYEHFQEISSLTFDLSSVIWLCSTANCCYDIGTGSYFFAR